MYYEIMILRNYYKLEETNFNEFKLILKCIIEIKIFVNFENFGKLFNIYVEL